MITTTLKRIRKHHPCKVGWETILEGLGKTKADAEPLPFARIVEINGFHDALWCCRVEPQYAREWRLFAVWCARQVQHLMPDPRSVAAIDVAEFYARGEATRKEMDAALIHARAARAAGAPYAAGAAMYAVCDDDAALVACAANAVYATGGSYSVRAAVAAQIKEFLRVVNETENRS
jgi:hypothetical protein